ncbi:MAG: GNAT family N-acetyltransferase [Pseudomonadota bacterium]
MSAVDHTTVPSPADVQALAAQLLEAARRSRHRRLLVLAGAAPWCRATAAELVAALKIDPLWVGEPCAQRPQAETPKAARAHLGREYPCIVFDAHAGFEPDAFGLISGSLHGGGLFVLLTPPLQDWPMQTPGARFFLARFVARLGADRHATVVQEHAVLPGFIPSTPAAVTADVAPPYRTEDQRAAVAAILQVVRGHRRRPLVLTSDRGRGKSAALGIAAAQLIEQGLKRILVTAPRIDACGALFERAAAELRGARSARGRIERADAVLEFIAPDALIEQLPAADLLLIDEAAAIPAPMLEAMLRHYSRVVFASTVHGYEGTGRGFAVRFMQTLARLAPGWKSLRLETPVRWAPGDPLERFVFDALLLDAAAAEEARLAGVRADECVFERCERETLWRDEASLRELFGLLVLSHYRTTPNDLRELLDAPALEIYLMRARGHVVAAALVVREGGIEPGLAREIYLGRRRVHGHLLAQSLAVHLGIETAPTLRYARVMRIAVHPALQRHGIGRALLSQVVGALRARPVDVIGASFGAVPEVLAFWRACGFAPVRVGLTREHSSGAHSALVAQALTAPGGAVLAEARRQYQRQLPGLLSGPLRTLEAPLALMLLADDAPRRPLALDASAWRDALSFACGQRGYEVCQYALLSLVLQAVSDAAAAARLDEQDAGLLVAKIVQQRDWHECARRCGFSGHAEAVAALRAAVRRLAVAHAPPELLRLYQNSAG